MRIKNPSVVLTFQHDSSQRKHAHTTKYQLIWDPVKMVMHRKNKMKNTKKKIKLPCHRNKMIH